MTYLLPPLNALRAFEAAARHLSFTRAAHELHVTAGAVGQPVRAVERVLGVSLFERAHNELTLTPLGRDYLAALSKAFTRLAATTAGLRPASVALVRLGARAGLPMSGTHGLVAEVDRFRLNRQPSPCSLAPIWRLESWLGCRPQDRHRAPASR